MNRRQFLATAGSGIGALSGCTTGSNPATPTGGTNVDSPQPEAIFVDGDAGSSNGAGTKSDPLDLVQEAVDRVEPGQTVHILPGEYYEDIVTKRAGQTERPITITGPPDAVLHGNPEQEDSHIFTFQHSHIHIKGLSFDGLREPSQPETAASYAVDAFTTLPVWERNDSARASESSGTEGYLMDLMIKPHAIGNTRTVMVKLNFVQDVEIGDFRVSGPAGLDFKLGARVGHVGEIVYIGNPVGGRHDQAIDRTNNVHVHHIDASAGHYHIELVDVKAACHDVTIEYCTSVDASLPNDVPSSTAVHLGGHDIVFRWNRIRSPAGRAIDVGNYARTNDDIPHSEVPKAGAENAIYGNELLNPGERAINYTSETSEQAQRVVCGNIVDGETEGNPDRSCSDDIPQSDEIGHLGGESPWG